MGDESLHVRVDVAGFDDDTLAALNSAGVSMRAVTQSRSLHSHRNVVVGGCDGFHLRSAARPLLEPDSAYSSSRGGRT